MDEDKRYTNEGLPIVTRGVAETMLFASVKIPYEETGKLMRTYNPELFDHLCLNSKKGISIFLLKTGDMLPVNQDIEREVNTNFFALGCGFIYDRLQRLSKEGKFDNNLVRTKGGLVVATESLLERILSFENKMLIKENTIIFDFARLLLPLEKLSDNLEDNLDLNYLVGGSFVYELLEMQGEVYKLEDHLKQS
jgi:hypothetical protein